jgi:excisionase family DNA binding protein
MHSAITQAGLVNSATNDLISESQAAQILGVAPGTLSVWRCTRRYQIPFVKVGRSVRYSRKALQAWIDERTYTGEVA